IDDLVAGGRSMLALQLPDGSLRELCAQVYSFVVGPTELLAGWLPEASAWVWSTAEGWRLRRADGPPEEVRPGKEWTIGGVQLRAVCARVEELERRQTVGGLEGLHIVSRYTNVQIMRGRQRPVSLDGIPARILAELGSIQGPVPWEDIAEGIWKKESDRIALRRKWDRGVRRLRLELKEAGIRGDLIRADGKGGFELLLYLGDRFEDADGV
ncbi:MAG TPA: hypothetical protein PKY30_07380, partial [Myxococcota bacterium]|nr:hypothetical protein [Myxococcota bacterium]